MYRSNVSFFLLESINCADKRENYHTMSLNGCIKDQIVKKAKKIGAVGPRR